MIHATIHPKKTRRADLLRFFFWGYAGAVFRGSCVQKRHLIDSLWDWRVTCMRGAKEGIVSWQSAG